MHRCPSALFAQSDWTPTGSELKSFFHELQSLSKRRGGDVARDKRLFAMHVISVLTATNSAFATAPGIRVQVYCFTVPVYPASQYAQHEVFNLLFWHVLLTPGPAFGGWVSLHRIGSTSGTEPTNAPEGLHVRIVGPLLSEKPTSARAMHVSKVTAELQLCQTPSLEGILMVHFLPLQLGDDPTYPPVVMPRGSVGSHRKDSGDPFISKPLLHIVKHLSPNDLPVQVVLNTPLEKVTVEFNAPQVEGLQARVLLVNAPDVLHCTFPVPEDVS
jgi:hypothetical protein